MAVIKNKIVMPDFLTIEMENFIKSIYGIKMDDRIFTISKSYLHHEMDRGAKLAGVKRIRIHGLRHPYVKHTTKNISLQKQKARTIRANLVVWAFCFYTMGFAHSFLEEVSIPNRNLILQINQKSFW